MHKKPITQKQLAKMIEPYCRIIQRLNDPAVMNEFFKECEPPMQDQRCFGCGKKVYQLQDIDLIKKCTKCQNLYHGRCAKSKENCCGYSFASLTPLEEKLILQLKKYHQDKEDQREVVPEANRNTT